MVAWDRLNDDAYAYDWTTKINEKFKNLIGAGDHNPLINYAALGKEAMLAIPTPEHYLPLMYTLGAKTEQDNVSFFNDKAVGGSLTMTSVKLG
jgi:4,5-DOPA dioxygenase extradiol